MILLTPMQRMARRVFGDYKVFVIMAADGPGAPPSPSDRACLGIFSTPAKPDPGAGYGGPDAHGFEWREGERRLCFCWVWQGERYRRERNFWPLAATEAKLISLETEPAARGRGIAPKVVNHARATMADLGITRLYARIWHSNIASLRAFEKAGWRRHATVVEIYPFGRPLRFTFRRRGSQAPDQIVQPVGGQARQNRQRAGGQTSPTPPESGRFG